MAYRGGVVYREGCLDGLCTLEEKGHKLLRWCRFSLLVCFHRSHPLGRLSPGQL